MPYKDREVRLAYLREYHKKRLEEDPLYNYKRYHDNIEHNKAKNAEWKAQNPERIKELWKRSQKKNLRRINAYMSKRRADKLQATPKWLTKEQLEEIKQFYINCPKGYHVDHIYPLKGKECSGLHVPWNLQYLPARENILKGNKLI